MNKPSDYESTAIQQIHAWKNPELGWFGWVMKQINWPIDKLGDATMKVPGIGWVLEKTVGGIVRIANDVAQWSVRPSAIYEEYRNSGFTKVQRSDDIYTLDLANVDRVIGWLDAKYKGLAATEGAAAGLVGLPGIPPDVAALILLNLRAIGEYATYCGFDINRQEELLFAMHVLGLASSPNDASKTLALAQLTRIARDVARDRTWKQLQEHTFVAVIQRIAKSLERVMHFRRRWRRNGRA